MVEKAIDLDKFRYISGDNSFKRDKFSGVNPSVTQDQDAIVSNGLFTAMPWHGTATIAVFPAYKFKRFENDIFLIKGHDGPITDVQFSPFAPQLLASTSEDSTIKLWILKDKNGLKEHMVKPAAELIGHNKKTLQCAWHHIAENTMATTSVDNTVRMWDIES